VEDAAGGVIINPTNTIALFDITLCAGSHAKAVELELKYCEVSKRVTPVSGVIGMDCRLPDELTVSILAVVFNPKSGPVKFLNDGGALAPLDGPANTVVDGSLPNDAPPVLQINPVDVEESAVRTCPFVPTGSTTTSPVDATVSNEPVLVLYKSVATVPPVISSPPFGLMNTPYPVDVEVRAFVEEGFMGMLAVAVPTFRRCQSRRVLLPAKAFLSMRGI
jgi:hypothetical protein